MYCQHYLPSTGRFAVAATRHRWSRRMFVAVAACVLALLPAGGIVGAVPSTSSGPKDYPPNLIVQSTGAPDERLDVAAALDEGTRLLLLQARYRDAGNGQADYYLAGPQGVSHQPLRALFPPLGSWLAAPGHEHAMVMIGLRIDPRSANPARFDTACQAFMNALGPHLLRASDLPAGKALDELTPAELTGAWRAQPRVVTDWSACTGEEPPLGRHKAQPAAAVPVEDHWMADQKDIIGQRPLRQVVIPGSHDPATYEAPSPFCPAGECWPGGPIEAIVTQAQSQDITAQLNAGSRYLDLRFSYWDGEAGKDFFVFHNTSPSYLKMAKVLIDIVTWINQPGHEKEIVWLDMLVSDEDKDSSQSKAICDVTLGWERAQAKVLQSSMLPPNTALTDLSMNEIWALPGQPQIIVTGWSSCTGDNPMIKGGTWAGRCWAQNIWDQLSPRLATRTDGGKNLVTGAYVLAVQGTPWSSDWCPDPPLSILALAPQQNASLLSLKFLAASPTQNPSRANLNVVAGDFLGDPAGEGWDNWPIVQTALYLNQSLVPEALSWKQETSASVTVSCNNPVIFGPTTMVVYPVVEGPQSPNIKTFTTDQGYPGVQGTVSTSDFPGAGPAPDGSYLVAACTRQGSPLDPPGSSSGVQISRIVIPYFGNLFQLSAEPINPVELSFTCSYSPYNVPLQVTAYPAADPSSPDAQVFSGNGTVQATYKRRGSYDVHLECATGNAFTSTLVRDSAFPPALTIRPDQQDRWLCERSGAEVQNPFTLNLTALTPNAPYPLSVTGFPTVVLTVPPDYFPFGDYLLTASCVSSPSVVGEQPWTATPLTLSSSQIPHREVDAEITGCSKQGGNAFTCALQVTLGAPLAVNTVFTVGIQYLGIGSGGFNPSGGDRPHVTAFPGCHVAPLPSPYYPGNDGYNHYDVNISTDGCQPGAVVTFSEAVTGEPGAPITQSVIVPGLDTSMTIPLLLPQETATRTGMAPVDPAVFSGR